MSNSLLYIAEQFKGRFVAEPQVLRQKLMKIKAFVFDWDGVFNNGEKDEKGSSPYNEVDAMGTNLLRFNHYLRNQTPPIFAIVSGETNRAAFALSEREHFHASYCGIKFKQQALEHLCKQHDLKPAEVAFVFDDVLDLSLAEKAGLRIMVSRTCNPLLIDYAIAHHMVDYLTANDGGNYAVREVVELLNGISGLYDETITHRKNFSEEYQRYLKLRNEVKTEYFTLKESEIVGYDDKA